MRLISTKKKEIFHNHQYIYDIDGNIYRTIIVGNQEWTIENLRVTKYADGSAIQNILLNGATDWFLPSYDELTAMDTQLYQHSVGNFSAVKYWSSSEYSATQALSRDFGAHSQSIESKGGGGDSKYIRPIRTFNSSDIYSIRDIGPSGGLIFHVVDIGGGTFTYYEAAPEDSSWLTIWSNVNDTAGATGTSIGDGPANSSAIINQVGFTGGAAKICDDTIVDGWCTDTIGAYCLYANSASLKRIYGCLYNQYAIQNAKGLVYFAKGGINQPGWRIATKADYDTLINLIGDSSDAGGLLKEIGITHWTSPNTDAIDQYGFKALPGGVRNIDGSFANIGNNCLFWTSTINPAAGTYYFFNLEYNSAAIGNTSYSALMGASIRCVRDI